MSATNLYFFQPRIGAKYTEGIKGVKTLILGASFYCKSTDCKFFDICTVDSRPFDEICPDYACNHLKLSDSATIEVDSYLDIDGKYRSYGTFTQMMREALDDSRYQTSADIWEHVAFYNYVQHILPTTITPSFYDGYEDDFAALVQVIKQLQPQLIIVWGKPVRDALDTMLNGHIQHLDDGYYQHMATIKGKQIKFLYLHHPSYRGLNDSWDEHIHHLKNSFV